MSSEFKSISSPVSLKDSLQYQYIYKKKALELVKHYSLFGSNFMNEYLREKKITNRPFGFINIDSAKKCRKF